MAQGIALIVGLKSVDPSAYPDGWDGKEGAEGCERDVDNMIGVVSSAGHYKIHKLTTNQAKAEAILNEIRSAAATLKSGDTFVFYYSGHGGRITGTNGEVLEQYVETLVAYDREILDDELAKLWLQFASGVKIVMLSDSCHSGTNDGFTVLHANQKSHISSSEIEMKKFGWYVEAVKMDHIFSTKIEKKTPIKFDLTAPRMKAQLIHFGACKDDQDAAGHMIGSAFTLALCEAWNKGKFSGTYPKFYEAIKAKLKEKEYSQEPQFNKYGNVQPAFLNSKPFSI